MNKQQIEKRLKELNKMPFTDEVIKEISYLEMQLERIIDNE